MVDWIWPLSVLGQNSNLDWIFKSHSRSRSLPFPGIPASHSLSQKSGRQFSFPFPFPNIGNAIFIPVPIPKSWEWKFSFPFPFPKFGNGLSYSRSRSQSPKSHSRSPLVSWPTFEQKWTRLALKLKNLQLLSSAQAWMQPALRITSTLNISTINTLDFNRVDIETIPGHTRTLGRHMAPNTSRCESL